jgi:hypothetical protein
MNTQQLISKLQAKYPHLNFGLYSVNELGIDSAFPEDVIKEANPPEQFIAFEFEGIGVWDCYSSTCSRFLIDPKKTYSIDIEDAKKIKEHNKISMH